MTGYAPEPRKMSASSKRMRRVEIQGQEASWASKADWEMSRAIGSAGAIEMASRVLRILVFLIQIFLS